MSEATAKPDEIKRVMQTLARRGGIAKARAMSTADRREMSRRMHEAKAAKRAA